MRFAHKLRKLADPRILRSGRRHFGRVLLTRRLVFRLEAEKIIASIDQPQFQAIHARHAVDDPGGGWRKYLALDRWMGINLRRVQELELDWGRRQSILDIGSGAGYFLYIGHWLGHRTLGLDIEDVEMFGEMFRALGLERVISRVEAFEPLPALDRKFDLITAFMICFNGHKSPALWGPKEWAFFLDDLEMRLNPGGRIRLGFNREDDGSFYTEELRRFFLERGAEVDLHRVTLRPRRRRR
ncbi:MAG: class I SAM-dependent methyltransferase [Chthoniobacterales bacterium]